MPVNFKTGKELETINFYKRCKETLSGYLMQLNGVRDIEISKEMYLVPATNERYLVYITHNNNFVYYYFYSVIGRHFDFCIESDIMKVDKPIKEVILYCVLFETNDQKNICMISDVFWNKRKIDAKYDLRYFMMMSIVDELKLRHIHPKYKFQVSPRLDVLCSNLDIFEMNFKYKYTGYVLMKDSYEKEYKVLYQECKEKMLRIYKTEKTDVYKVYDIETNECYGLLFVKTLKDSKYLRVVLECKDFIEHTCKYNTDFYKWQITCV